MKSFVFTIISLLFSFISIAQTAPNKDELKKMGIYEYYPKLENDSLLLNPDEIGFLPFSIEDIDSNYYNTVDLDWLEEIPKNNKVLLIGETHYSTAIHNIQKRILFGINNIDYYPLVIFEKQYSRTPFVNYFLNLVDDVKAREYFVNTLASLVDTKDDSLLYEQIRYWNKNNPDKKIEVGFIDMEFNSEKVFHIIKPYFERLPVDKSKIDSVFNLWPSETFFQNIEIFLGLAEKEKLVGDFPFIDIRYIKNVISNLRYTYYFFNFDPNELSSYYRAKGIIHNLTNENVFGNVLKNSKVIIIGGGYHTTNFIQYPDGGNFFREGSYLTYDFPPTRGKTFSVMIEGIAFMLGKMSGISLENKSCGYQYRDITSRLKKAFDQGLIESDKPYFTFNNKDEFYKLVAFYGFKYDSSALLLDKCSWDKLIKDSKNSNKDLQNIIYLHKKEIDKYNKYIFVPYSPIEVLREKSR